jgi:hypothetical protein
MRLSEYLRDCVRGSLDSRAHRDKVCSAVQCSAVQCSAVQYNAVQCSAVQYSAVQCSAGAHSDKEGISAGAVTQHNKDKLAVVPSGQGKTLLFNRDFKANCVLYFRY